jgi:hypothetical protein
VHCPYISNDSYEMVSMVFDLHFQPDHLATGLDSMNVEQVELNTGPMGMGPSGGFKMIPVCIFHQIDIGPMLGHLHDSSLSETGNPLQESNRVERIIGRIMRTSVHLLVVMTTIRN